ncbi:MAG: hypothetical protein CMM22_03355, partial [Rhodospirillaceae bacterium]|nr:hypothetical protein [Rhodospirillaceae bacterium]
MSAQITAKKTRTLPPVLGAALAVSLAFAAQAADVKMDDSAKPVEHSPTVFKPDPDYKETPYSPEAQRKIYGGKSAVETPRPLFEAGRKQYVSGPFEEGIDLVGRKNLMFPGMSIYGDWRTAVAYNDNGGTEVGRVATRLNLDVDLKLTSTERIHAFLRPLDQAGNFTRFDFSADDEDQGELVADGNLETLFFEGDLGSIATGLSDEYSDFDLPFALGLMPLLFQNGVWLEDAFIGAAFTIPARNSKALD